jgi:hypothetical protein
VHKRDDEQPERHRGDRGRRDSKLSWKIGHAVSIVCDVLGTRSCLRRSCGCAPFLVSGPAPPASTTKLR